MTKKINKKKNDFVSVVIVTANRRDDLIECVESFVKSSYKPLEIIVVDNGSRPPIFTWFRKRFPGVKLISSPINTGAAEGRNIGYKASKGKYILFSDDDANAAKDMISVLVDVFKQKKNAGIVQPLVYDKDKPDMLQGAGHDFSLLTGKIKAWGVREKDLGQYDGIRKVPMCGCVWMVKKSVFEKIGLYDKDYFIPYEDSDFSVRARKAGYDLYCASDAKTWHQGPKKTYVHSRVEYLGITSPTRAYYTMRNKIIFMAKHSPFPNNFIFFGILFPGYLFAHSILIISSSRIDIFFRYWLGVLSGVLSVFLYPVRLVAPIFEKIDRKLDPIKYLVMSWEDPLVWLFNKDAKTVLDLGCGDGKLMQLIKIRKKIEYCEGIDTYAPYIEKAKKRKVFNKCIKGDIRKVRYKKDSFDVVIVSHVLEHMRKSEALKVLSNAERIASKQVLVATPIGEKFNALADENEHQLHLSYFDPEEFEKMGYQVLRYGWDWLLGEDGLIGKTQNGVVKKILYTFNVLLTPLYYFMQSSCDYVFAASKIKK